MENLTQLVSQLEAAHINISDVARKLKVQILEMENQAHRYDFIIRETRDRALNEKNKQLRIRLMTHYRRMMSHELGLVQESDQIRFENICRNAQMQMEGLLAYFYQHQFSENVQQFVSVHNAYVEEVNRRGGSHRVIQHDKWSKITYANKYFLFQKFTQDAELTNFVKVLSGFRNRISHLGYESRASGTTPDDKVSIFAKLKDINAVLDALEQLREYVEYNTI